MYFRPVCLLILCLYGHPESGALFEQFLTAVLNKYLWEAIPDWFGVFTHPDGSTFVVYVDDLMLLATPDCELKHWLELEGDIVFKDPVAPLDRYLGAYHRYRSLEP